MVEIDNRELTTLEDIAALGEHSVLDGATLYSLLRKELVELSECGMFRPGPRRLTASH